MLGRQRRAEVVRDRFIDAAIDASNQNIHYTRERRASDLTRLVESLWNDVFSLGQSAQEQFLGNRKEQGLPIQEAQTEGPVDQLTTFTRMLTNNHEQHPLFEQIAVIHFLATLDPLNNISSLFNPNRENELNFLIASAEKTVMRCEKEASQEIEKNKKLAQQRSKNTERKTKAERLVEEYRSSFLEGNHGDIRDDDPTPAQTEAYNKARVFLYGRNIKAQALEAARNELSDYERQIEQLEQQKSWLDRLEDIRQMKSAAANFVQKYPTARELVTVEQFLFCLMADVLVTLNILLESYKASLGANTNIREFNKQHINIKRQINDLTRGGYLPKALEVHHLFKTQNESDLFQFMSDIGAHKRLQYTSTSPTAAIARINSQRSTADDEEKESVSDSSPHQPAPEEVVSATPYFPVYLAKSFMLHLAEAMETYASGLKGSDENTSRKKELMQAAATWLRERDPQAEPAMTSFKDIYDAKLGESTQTIAQILNSQRHLGVGSKPSDAFAKTLTQAGLAFLKENPASLMRRHAFLEWLQETCTFPEAVDLTIGKGHLIEAVAQIKALRSVIKLLYPASSAPVTAKTILACVSQLVAFGKEKEDNNPNIAILVRFLLLAGVDKLDSADFARLKHADKGWLLNSEEIITDKQGYLKAVAQNITATTQYGIGPFVTALLEITSFQQARYESLLNSQQYTHQEHQEKVEPTILHLSECVENYFEASALKTKAQMPQPARVAKVFSTSDLVAEQIQLIVRSYESGARLRLPVNLLSDVQATLTWGVTGDDPVHLRTLALLNSGNAEGLCQWTLKLVSFDSPAAKINAAMLQQGSDYAENLFSQLGALNSLAERIKHYTALVALAETLLQHLTGEQSQSGMPENADLAQFYKAVNDNMNRLMEVIAQETSAEEKSEEDGSALEKLAARVQAFSAGLISACYSMGTETQPINIPQNVLSIRREVFGDKILDPKNPAFFAAFKQIAESGFRAENDQYFIDVMFTLAHHPMYPDAQSRKSNNLEAAVEKAKLLCGIISSLFPYESRQGLRTLWDSLYTNFYGNSEGLQQLINYYFSVEELNDVVIKKALKIAIFGFAYPDFAENKLMFAQQILRAFAALAQLGDDNTPGKIMDECHDSIVYLKQAFALLATTPGLRFELGAVIGGLKALAEEIGDETENHFYSLDIEAKKQAVIYAQRHRAPTRHDVITKGTLLGLEIGAARYQAQAKRHKRAVSSLSLSTQVVAAGDVVARSGDALFTPYSGQARNDEQIRADFSAIITGLVDGAFPEYDPASTAEPRIRMRYFLTKAWRRDENKLDRQKLKDMLWEEIQAQTASGKQIESSALYNAIKQLFMKVDAVRVTSDISGFQTVQLLRSATATIAERTAIKLVTTEKVFFEKKTLAHIAGQAAAGLNGLIAEQAALLQPGSDDALEEPLRTGAAPLSNIQAANDTHDFDRNTVDASRDSDQVPEISEAAVTNAVIAAIEWLEGSPTVDNIPSEVSRVIDTSELSQENIDEFKRRLAAINVNWFAYRVKLIRAGKSDRALEHVVNNVRQSQRSQGSSGELDALIGELNSKIEGRQTAEYQRYLKDFVWAVAETAAFQRKRKQNPYTCGVTGEKINLLQLVINHRFNKVALIALGCEQYAMMSEEARINKGSRLLEALLHLVFNSDLFYREAHSSLPPECNTLISKLQNALITRNSAQPRYDDGTEIYYLIYTLAQAMSYEEDSVIKVRYAAEERDTVSDSGLETEDYTYNNVDTVESPADDGRSIAASVDAPVTLNDSVARQLLDRLNALLFSNPTFSEWHRRIIKMGSGYESSLHVLTFREEYSVAEMRSLLADPRHNDSAAVISRILQMGYFWQISYTGKENPDRPSQRIVTVKNFREQFAYEALAIDELVRILNATIITEVDFANFNAKDQKYATQHNSILEQLALVFLAAKRWYKPEKHKTAAEGVLENSRTPFIPALSLLASGFAWSGKEDASFELMIKSLLEKACDSFNAMLLSKDQEKYALKTPEYAALKQEVIKWLKDTPEILTVYVARTLETGVHCKEQAELIFQLLSQASDTPTTELIPRDRHNGRSASTGFELSIFSSKQPKSTYSRLATEENNMEEEVSIAPNSSLGIIDASNVPRSDDKLPLLFKAFECMYQYIDQGIPKKTRLKLFTDTVELRLREFLTQVEKHNLWEDYWTYVAGLEQSDTVKNYVVGNRCSEKGKLYLKLYTDLLSKRWVANFSGEEVSQKVVMGHLFGNYLAIGDNSVVTIIANIAEGITEENQAKLIQYVADKHAARGLIVLAECLVTSGLKEPLVTDDDKVRDALAVIEFVHEKMLPAFLVMHPNQEDKKKFIHCALLKPLGQFFECNTKDFPQKVIDSLKTFGITLGIDGIQPPTQISDDAAYLRNARSSGITFNRRSDQGQVLEEEEDDVTIALLRSTGGPLRK